jgi:hypothetical protein
MPKYDSGICKMYQYVLILLAREGLHGKGRLIDQCSPPSSVDAQWTLAKVLIPHLLILRRWPLETSRQLLESLYFDGGYLRHLGMFMPSIWSP